MNAPESLHVAVIDIGSCKNLGWTIEGASVTESGTDIDRGIDALARAMEIGPLALGFEAPMFVPYGRKRDGLDKARNGDGDRAFAASAGACSLTKALVVVPYILNGIRLRVPEAKPTFKWRERLSERDLLLFEAFVTHVGKDTSHVESARLALKQFPKSCDRASFKSAVDEPCTMNLLGAVLLRIGWSDETAVLSEHCLVVRHRGTR